MEMIAGIFIILVALFVLVRHYRKDNINTLINKHKDLNGHELRELL